MSFIKNDGQGTGLNLLTYIASIPKSDQFGEFAVTIEFVTVPTISGVKFDVSKEPRGQFIGPLVDKPFSTLAIGGIDLTAALLAAPDTKDLVKYLTDPDSTKEPDKQFINIGSHCTKLMAFLQKNFSSRDAGLVYWAILKRYEPLFVKIKEHSQCLLDFRRGELGDLGLKTEDLFDAPTDKGS